MRDGKIINLIYDNLGRLKTRDLPGYNAELDIDYTYDNLGRLTGATGTDVEGGVPSQITLNRDALGRLVKEVNTQGDLRYTYDLAGRRTALIWMNGSTDGFTINYDYLVTGELDRVRENGALSGVGLLASYSYDDLGRRTGLNRSNGTSTSWSYGTSPWLTSLTQHLAANTGSDLTRGFPQRSVIGEIRQVTSSNPAYAHGGYANVSRGYSTADALNRYPGNTGATFGYDGRRNLTSSISTASGALTSYSYRSENGLTVRSGARFRCDQFLGTAAPAYGSADRGTGVGLGSTGAGATIAAGSGSAPAKAPRAPRKPLTIDDAPNKMKQPSTTIAPRRSSTRPDNMSRPTAAIARIATPVATEPRTVPCSQFAAATKTL